MTRFLIITMAVVLAVGSAATAEVVEVKHENWDSQDVLEVPEVVLELGVGFPEDELIEAGDTITDYSPCRENPDDPDIPNALVRMTNLTQLAYDRVWYVADGRTADGVGPETTLQNMDGTVNQGLAFLIDYDGLNQPLLQEVDGVAGDNIWQPGETWEFVIQDYRNVNGLPASALDSVGLVGDFSAGLRESSGSIIAVPEPATMSLVALGGLGIIVRRRRNA